VLNGITVFIFILIYCPILTCRCDIQLCRPLHIYSRYVAISRDKQWGLAGPEKGLDLPMLLMHQRSCMDVGTELTAAAAALLNCSCIYSEYIIISRYKYKETAY